MISYKIIELFLIIKINKHIFTNKQYINTPINQDIMLGLIYHIIDRYIYTSKDNNNR